MEQARVLIWGAVLVASLTIGSVYAAGPSWNNQPSWAQQPGSDNVNNRRRKDYSSSDEKPVAPFSPGSNNVSLDVGQVFLMGDLGNKYNDALGMQLHYTYGVSEIFGFDSSIGYSNHAISHSTTNHYSMTTALMGLRTNLAYYDKVIPYFSFGLGFYKPSFDVGSGANLSSVSPVVFGLHMGPGVDLQITKQLYFGAALAFHDIFGNTQDTTVGPVDVGGSFTSFFLHAGMAF